MTTPIKYKWPSVPLGDVAEFRNGVNYSKVNFGKGVKVIGVSDFQDNVKASFGDLEEINPAGVVRKEHYLRDGDILFVRSNGNRDLIGRNMFVENPPEEVTHSAFSIRLRFVRRDCLPRFYAYVLRSPLFRQSLSLHGGGTNISNLNQDILGRLQVPLPPRPIQDQIASILSAYDDLIENNTRRIKILEEMAQMIYREWFVDFRFPGHEKTKMVKTEKGYKPAGWNSLPFTEAAQFINGFAFGPEHWRNSGQPIIKIKELKNGITSDTPRYDGEGLDEKYVIHTGDILFSWSADLDVYIWSGEQALLNQHLFRVLAKNGYGRLFIFFSLKNQMQSFRSLSMGTTMRHIKRSALNEVEVTVPDRAVLDKFENLLTPLAALVTNLSQNNSSLRRIRDLLLPKLISGEVNIEELETESANRIS